MANVNRPQGFKPIRHLNGSMYNGQMNLYFIPPSDANAYAVGDMVTIVGTTNSTDLYALGVPIVTLTPMAVMSGLVTHQISCMKRRSAVLPGLQLLRISLLLLVPTMLT